MKILIMGIQPMYCFHYLDSLVCSCEALGHQVLKIVIKDFKEAENKTWKIRLVKLGMKNLEMKYNQKRDENNRKIICGFQPDISIILNGLRIDETMLKFLRDENINRILFMTDSLNQEHCRFTRALLPYYDQIFSYESKDIDSLNMYNHIKYLFIGYEEAIFYPTLVNIKKEIDICYVGGLDQTKLPLLEEVATYAYENNKKLVIHTLPLIKGIWCNIKNLKAENKREEFSRRYPNLDKFIIEKPVYNEDLSLLYEKSKICINLHSRVGMHTDANPRTFEILGSGAFELIDQGHLKNTELKSGEHLVEYKDAKDLCEKIDYYLTHDEDREIIATAGHAMAKEKYTMKNCIQTILNSVI